MPCCSVGPAAPRWRWPTWASRWRPGWRPWSPGSPPGGGYGRRRRARGPSGGGRSRAGGDVPVAGRPEGPTAGGAGHHRRHAGGESVGSLVLGFIAGLGLYHGAPGSVLTVVGTGFVGAYTTFSAFALATVALAEDGEWRRTLANVALSVGGGLAPAMVGLA